LRCVALVLLFVFASVLSCFAQDKALPDLDVTHIERTPKYTPGPWIYPEKGPQYLGDPETKKPLTPDDLKGKYRQNPEPGEKVTFTAHVANQSDTPAPAFAFEWYLDGKKIKEGTHGGIEPWGRATEAIEWTWDSQRHFIKFVADPANQIAELCEANNAVEDPTDALSFQMRVPQALYDAFRKQPNKLGSYSFEDWCQRHVKIMNGVLAGSVYPKTAPQGILERVRIDDFVFMTKEEMGKKTPQPFGCDGGWNFYDDALGKANSWFDFHIKDNFVDRVDTGLLHELTHQIGIIDMYCIVVGAQWNHAPTEEGEPVFIPYATRQPGMMGGGGPFVDFDGSEQPALTFSPDKDGNVKVGLGERFAAYEELTAAALNTLRGVRRGHFGLYLFFLPKESFLRILDNTGKPVEGASITIHQQMPKPGPQSIPATPTMQGKTDADGKFALGPRPLGDINCIGLNGTLMFTIEARGHREYRLLDVSHFAIAKSRGLDPWTAEFRTGIPPAGAPEPPKNLRYARVAQGQKPALVLAWDPSPSKDVASYNIYQQRTYGKDRRATNLSVTFESPYVKIASVPAEAGTSVGRANMHAAEVEPLPGYGGVNEHPWFTVTAVDKDGRESAQARNWGLTSWGPWGNALVERADAETVKVTLAGGPSSIQVRRSFVVGKDAQLRFRVKADADTPSSIRLTVAGLGDVDVLVTGAEEGKPVVGKCPDLADGDWHDVAIPLRAALDRLAAEKKVTPAQARTTWNADWLITDCKFGRWAGGGTGKAVFWFQKVQIK